MSSFESSPLANLEPTLFWRHFFSLTQIPRGSGNEKAAGNYIVQNAERLGLPYRRDDVGNVVVSKPGTTGLENAPGVILQSHLDMVCEKNRGWEHDFLKDPLKVIVEDGKVGAQGTSLGADNGVGVASSLAIMEDATLTHGPLEFLFTVDEERGLTGVKSLTSDFLKHRQLLNLDSEEEGVVFVGCAGGMDAAYILAPEHAPVKAGHKPYNLKLLGLRGGHSGIDIHEGRGNAIKLLGRVLWNSLKAFDMQLGAFEGGTLRNAIPREADAIVFINPAQVAHVKAEAAKWESIFAGELDPVDPGVKVQLLDVEGAAPQTAFTDAFAQKLLDVVCAIPHGVLGMSKVIENLVETSTNLATLNLKEGSFVVGMSHRSSRDSAMQCVQQSIETLARLSGVTYQKGGSYPGWQPDMTSKVLKTARELYQKMHGAEFIVKAVHAGLECGLLGEKFPGMDMISFGPNLSNVHSPDERLEIASVPRFYSYVLALLLELQKVPAAATR